MSIFDNLVQAGINAALGSNSETAQNQTQDLVKGVLNMLQNNNGGGLSGLINKFQESGQSEAASSWVGTGPNQPVTPDQVVTALGKDKVAELAAEAGIPEEKGAAVLAEVIPAVVDKVTPNGEVPPPNHLGTLAKVLLGGAGVALAAKAASSIFGAKAEAAEAAKNASPAAASGSVAGAATVAENRTYRVVSGDSLSKIAKQIYGDGNLWPRIFEANRHQLMSPDLIKPGQVLIIP